MPPTILWRWHINKTIKTQLLSLMIYDMIFVYIRFSQYTILYIISYHIIYWLGAIAYDVIFTRENQRPHLILLSTGEYHIYSMALSSIKDFIGLLCLSITFCVTNILFQNKCIIYLNKVKISINKNTCEWCGDGTLIIYACMLLEGRRSARIKL